MSCNKLRSIKVGEKLLSDLVIFSILTSDNALDFHNLIRIVPLKNLMCFSAGINTK